jgi:hypothetical protein
MQKPAELTRRGGQFSEDEKKLCDSPTHRDREPSLSRLIEVFVESSAIRVSQPSA